MSVKNKVFFALKYGYKVPEDMLEGIDIEAMTDGNLSYHENMEILTRQYPWLKKYIKKEHYDIEGYVEVHDDPIERDLPMKPDWFEIFEDPGIILILGARGSGKTALAHKLAEIYHENTDRKVYVFGFPQDKTHLLPEWMGLLNDIDLPQHSVVLVHEAHMNFHARRSMQDTNVLMDTLITISRHRDCTIIFETQQSFRLDKNIVAEADAIIIRYPSLLQERFERPFIKEFFTVASRFFSKYVKVVHVDDGIYKKPDKDKILRVAYVFSKNYMGPLRDITLPKHWSEELSRIYGYIPESAADPVKQLLMNPEVREILKKAVEIEEKRDYFPYWEAWEVGIDSPTLIHRLKKMKIIKVGYKSSRKTCYCLVDRDLIKKLLSEG